MFSWGPPVPGAVATSPTRPTQSAHLSSGPAIFTLNVLVPVGAPVGQVVGPAGCEPRDVKPVPGDLQTCSKPWALRCLQRWWGAVCGVSRGRVTRPYGRAQRAGSPLSPPEV